MKDFYYQIKGKNEMGWCFPPLFSGKITAEDRKVAKTLIEEEYGKQFPLRVLAKDVDSNEFLLSIKEIKDDDHYTRRLFEVRECKQCKKPYKIIEKYNSKNEGGGPDFCSSDCSKEFSTVANYSRWSTKEIFIQTNGKEKPIIYKITNKINGKCYIGKTTQIFTLRWYQHFFHGGDSKFHQEVRSTPVENWTFEILETIDIPDQIATLKEIDEIILGRERHYIVLYDSIENGYNSKI